MVHVRIMEQESSSSGAHGSVHIVCDGVRAGQLTLHSPFWSHSKAEIAGSSALQSFTRSLPVGGLVQAAAAYAANARM